MRTLPSFHEDMLELAARRHGERGISRRGFGAGVGALGALAAVGGGREAAAQAKELVYVNWGGAADFAYKEYYGKPFTARHPGVKFVSDTSGPSAGKIRAMVESKKITWDVCDANAMTALSLGQGGFLEKIDYSVVKRSDFVPGTLYEYGCSPYVFSNVLAYDATKFANDPPKGVSDFLNFQKYPGKRLLRRDANCMLEHLLVADGVPLDKIYPIDTKRAIDILKRHRKDLVFWTSGGESEQIMRTGEAVMGMIWNTRAKVLFDETRGKINWTWNGGVFQPGVCVVPKGNPGGAIAQQFFAFIGGAEDVQLGFFGYYGGGPSNPRAAARVSPDLKRFNPSDAANLKVQVVYDGEWWGKNYNDANQRYLDSIAG